MKAIRLFLNLLPILGNTLLTCLGLLKQKNFLENMFLGSLRN